MLSAWKASTRNGSLGETQSSLSAYHVIGEDHPPEVLEALNYIVGIVDRLDIYIELLFF